MMSRQQLHHLSGAYVLGALDPVERLLFEQRLPEWEDMRSEVTELADTAAALGLAVPPMEPGAELRQRVLELAARTPQLPPEQPSPDVAGRRLPDVAGRRRRQGVSAPWSAAGRPGARDARRPGRSGLSILAAISAGALALVAAVQLGPTLPGPEPALTAAQVAGAEDARRLAVVVPGASGIEVLYSERLQASVFAWDALPALPDGKVYELWYVDDEVRPAGLLSSATDGGTVLLDGEWSPGDRVGVTVEPAGGSPQPTSDPTVMLGPLV